MTQIDTGVDDRPFLTIGDDGLPIIGYDLVYDIHSTVAHCGNSECTSSTISALYDNSSETSGYERVGYVSVDIANDGLPLISRVLTKNSWPRSNRLRVSHCSDVQCTTASTATVLTLTNQDIKNPLILVGNDGVPIITYATNPNPLYVLRCGSSNCQ